MAEEPEVTLERLLTLQKEHELFITKVSEPIITQVELQRGHNGARNSDVSSAAEGSDMMTPASLSADLEHYKELFTKLRFSYIEQTTKEKFLRAVVGEPPIYVTAAENAELETHLATVKATLKSRKAEVADLVADLERQSRELSRRQQKIQADTEALVALPAKIAELQQKVEILTQAQAPISEDPALNVPLPLLLAMLEERHEESAKMDEQILQHETELERKAQELKRLQDELRPLEERKMDAMAAAGNARDLKSNGAKGLVGLEERGRWLRGVESTMTALLEVDA